MRIRYLPAAGPVGEVRFHRPARALRDAYGWDVAPLPVASYRGGGELHDFVSYDLQSYPDANVVVLAPAVACHGTDLKDGVTKLNVIGRWKNQGCKLIVDLDDHYGSIPTWSKASRMPEWQRGLIETLCRMADLVTVATQKLADYYGRHNRNVRVLPNRLDWTLWGSAPPRPARDRLRVGWYGGWSHRSGDLRVLEGVLEPLLDIFPQLDVFVAGPEAERSLDALGVPAGRRVTAPEVRYELLPRTLDFDVGVVPLAACAFNEAKSALKGMEMNACGIPYVASGTAPYRAFTRHGLNGFYVKGALRDSRDEFRRFLRVLVENESLRAEMGAAGRERVRAGYTLQEAIGDWRDAYESVLERRKAVA